MKPDIWPADVFENTTSSQQSHVDDHEIWLTRRGSMETASCPQFKTNECRGACACQVPVAQGPCRCRRVNHCAECFRYQNRSTGKGSALGTWKHVRNFTFDTAECHGFNMDTNISLSRSPSSATFKAAVIENTPCRRSVPLCCMAVLKISSAILFAHAWCGFGGVELDALSVSGRLTRPCPSIHFVLSPTILDQIADIVCICDDAVLGHVAQRHSERVDLEGMMQQHYEKCLVIFTRVSLNDMLALRA